MVGEQAPDIQATDVTGKAVSLRARDEGYTLVAFLRYSGCPWCNLTIHRLSLEYKRLLESGCEVIAFIQSEGTDVLDNVYRRHEVTPMFPIIADHERRFYKKYGVGTSLRAAARSVTKLPAWVEAVKTHGWKQQKVDGNVFIVPAVFLISNRTGKIVQADYGSSFYDHETFIGLYESLLFHETARPAVAPAAA